MIYVKFRGQLGNHMFQYAAARLTAERLGCPFVISQPGYSLRDFLLRKKKFALFRSYPELDRGVGMECVSVLDRHIKGPSEWIESRVFPTEFRPWSPSKAPGEGLEGFDPAYLTIPEFTRLVGFFQSPLYMKGHEETVRKWFARSPQEAADVEARWSALGLDPQRTVAVHVRLGDYRHMAPFGENPAGGWVLPRTYYREALDRISPSINIALFSDEPEAAAEHIGCPVDYISRTGNIRLDFLMMSSCKYMVIANSTFSWWAAWLNTSPGLVVFAPKFFLGRDIGVWYPRDIFVQDWQFV